MTSFSNLVNAKIDTQKVSLRKVAKEAGLDPSFLSKVLSGKRSPPSDEKILRKVAKFLEINPVLLIVSTGRIPSELQGLMENPKFLESLCNERAGESMLEDTMPHMKTSLENKSKGKKGMMDTSLSEDLL